MNLNLELKKGKTRHEFQIKLVRNWNVQINPRSFAAQLRSGITNKPMCKDEQIFPTKHWGRAPRHRPDVPTPDRPIGFRLD